MTAKADPSFKGLMFLLATTQLLLIVDASIINVIVPTIAQELGFSETSQSWIASAYLTVFGGVLLISGRIADLLGRARVFQVGVLVLVVGSSVSALAVIPEMLIAARAIQGLGSALSAAAGLALILATFDGEQRHRALGLLAAMGGFGGALGTFLGRAFTEWLAWRSTFWISVVIPIGLLLFSFSVFLRFESGKHQRQIDVLGGLLLIVGQTLLAFSIVQLGEAGKNSQAIWSSAITALILLGYFWVRQKRTADALIPPRTWRNAGLMEALVYSGVGQFVIFPMLFIGNLYLQSILNFSPIASGSAFLPLCAIIILTATNAGRWLKYGAGKSLASGFVLVPIGMLWLARIKVDSVFWLDIMDPTLLIGTGFPVIAITTNILAAQNANIGEEGLTSGLLNTFQQFGAVIGLSTMIAVASLYTLSLTAIGQLPSAVELLGGYKISFMMGGVIAEISAAALFSRP